MTVAGTGAGAETVAMAIAGAEVCCGCGAGDVVVGVEPTEGIHHLVSSAPLLLSSGLTIW